MRRSKRLEVVRGVADSEERRRAERLAACERRVLEAQSKLNELQSYERSYAGQLATRAASGMAAAELRDFHTFLARLAEAVRQQSELLARARAERDAGRGDWQQAAQRAHVVGEVVRRSRLAEQRADDKREQGEADERALRRPRRTHGGV